MRYSLKRTGEHAKLGVRGTIEPAETTLRELSSRESEPEPSRLETLLTDLDDAKRRAEGNARTAIAGARERLESYRSKR